MNTKIIKISIYKMQNYFKSEINKICKVTKLLKLTLISYNRIIIK